VSNEHMTVMLGAKHPLWDKLRVKAEGMQSVLTESGFILLLIFDPLSEIEARQMQEGQYRFGIVKIRGGFSWLIHTPVGYFDQPYSAGLEHPDVKLDEGNELLDNRKVRLALSVHTLDAGGIARALRFMTVSPEFSRLLERYHREGLREWAGREAWDAEIRRFYARYQTPQAAMKDAITCRGGE
jgi:hypothetical protein